MFWRDHCKTKIGWNCIVHPQPVPAFTMRHEHAVIHHRALDFWSARAAVLIIICLQLLVINDLSFGPRWLAPAIEAVLL
ncbi:MAG: hypothetical protein E5V44_11225, partial [Mesorhizobium sp.]